MNMRTSVFAVVLAIVSSPAYAQSSMAYPNTGAGSLPALVRELAAVVRDLSTLRARVDRLESGRIDAAGLVGRYALQMLGIEMGANPYVATETSGITMTLRADGTGEVTEGSGQGRCELRLEDSPSVACGSSGSSESFIWRLENGSFVFVSDDGEAAFSVGAGGRILVFGETTNFLPAHSWSNMVIAIRLPNEN